MAIGFRGFDRNHRSDINNESSNNISTNSLEQNNVNSSDSVNDQSQQIDTE